MSAAQETNAARSLSETAAGRRDPAPAWLTAGRERQDLRDAARAGAESADLVVRAQLDAGMTAEQIRASAERVLGDRFNDPTPVSDAFYDAYDATAATYVADMRDLTAEPRDIEAG